VRLSLNIETPVYIRPIWSVKPLSDASVGRGRKGQLEFRRDPPDGPRRRRGRVLARKRVRTTDKARETEIVFPSLNIKRALPVNAPVAIEFTPGKTGDIAFAQREHAEGVAVVQ